MKFLQHGREVRELRVERVEKREMGRESLPTLAMVMVQLGFAGMNVVSKLALDTGMSPYVLIAYRNIIAAVFLAPFAYYFERYTYVRMSISLRIVLRSS